jgi:hypothetical protein
MIKLLTYDEVGIGHVGKIEMKLGGVSNRSLKRMTMTSKEDYATLRDYSSPSWLITFEKHYGG